jgi:hypothetical protein
VRRLTCLLALLALSSLAFAPAPLPRRDRETLDQRRAREWAALVARLKELRVNWEVERGRGGPVLRAEIDFGGGESEIGFWPVSGGDLLAALRQAAEDVERCIRVRKVR